jgi:hypothetical protein
MLGTFHCAFPAKLLARQPPTANRQRYAPAPAPPGPRPPTISELRAHT